jgi:hypothetical protein
MDFLFLLMILVKPLSNFMKFDFYESLQIKYECNL